MQFNSQTCPQLLGLNRSFLSWMIAEESSFHGGINKKMVHQMGLLNESQISNPAWQRQGQAFTVRNCFLFSPIFPFMCQQLCVSAARHLCVWNRESWGFPPAKHQESNLCLCDLSVIYRPSLLHLSPGTLKPDQMEILCMSQWGESMPPGFRDVGSGAGLWLCRSPAAERAGTPARLKGFPGSLLVGRGPFRNKQVFPLRAARNRHHCHQSASWNEFRHSVTFVC